MSILRRISHLLLAAPVLLAGLVATGGSAGAAAARTALGPFHPVPLAVGGLSRARHLGAAPAGARHTIGVFLSRPDPAGEQSLYQALYDPASAMFHRFLSPSQFAAQFGVRPAQTRAVEGWLRSGGLRVTSVTGAGDYVTAQGTTTQLNRLFQTHIGRYRLGSTTFWANNRAPRVPVSLPVQAVVGLDTLHRFTPVSSRRSPAALARSLTAAVPGGAAVPGTPGTPAPAVPTPTVPAVPTPAAGPVPGLPVAPAAPAGVAAPRPAVTEAGS